MFCFDNTLCLFLNSFSAPNAVTNNQGTGFYLLAFGGSWLDSFVQDSPSRVHTGPDLYPQRTTLPYLAWCVCLHVSCYSCLLFVQVPVPRQPAHSGTHTRHSSSDRRCVQLALTNDDCFYAASLQAPSSPITTWPVLAVVCQTYAHFLMLFVVVFVCCDWLIVFVCLPVRCILNTGCAWYPYLNINAGVVYGNPQMYLGWSSTCGTGTSSGMKIQGLSFLFAVWLLWWLSVFCEGGSASGGGATLYLGFPGFSLPMLTRIGLPGSFLLCHFCSVSTNRFQRL